MQVVIIEALKTIVGPIPAEYRMVALVAVMAFGLVAFSLYVILTLVKKILS